MLSCLNRFLVVLTVMKPSMVYSIECDQEYFTLHLKTVAAKIVHGSK